MSQSAPGKGLNLLSLNTKLRNWGHHDLSVDKFSSEDPHHLTSGDDSSSDQEYSEGLSTQSQSACVSETLHPDIIAVKGMAVTVPGTFASCSTGALSVLFVPAAFQHEQTGLCLTELTVQIVKGLGDKLHSNSRRRCVHRRGDGAESVSTFIQAADSWWACDGRAGPRAVSSVVLPSTPRHLCLDNSK